MSRFPSEAFCSNVRPVSPPPCLPPVPIATSTPVRWRQLTPPRPSPGKAAPGAPLKKRAPLWRPYALEAIPRFPNLDTEREDEAKELEQRAFEAKVDAERRRYSKWLVRHKYSIWVPLEVGVIEDPVLLKTLYNSYKWPQTQPQNLDEVVYFQLMADAVEARIKALRPDLDSVEARLTALAVSVPDTPASPDPSPC